MTREEIAFECYCAWCDRQGLFRCVIWDGLDSRRQELWLAVADVRIDHEQAPRRARTATYRRVV